MPTVNLSGALGGASKSTMHARTRARAQHPLALARTVPCVWIDSVYSVLLGFCAGAVGQPGGAGGSGGTSTSTSAFLSAFKPENTRHFS